MEPIYTALALALAMIVLIFGEVLVPSFGVLSLLAVSALIGSVYFAARQSHSAAVFMFLVDVALVPAAIVFALKVLKRSPMVNPAAVAPTPAVADFSEKRCAGTLPHQELVGQKGIALSSLRPAGRAQFGERKISVQTQGELIDTGEEIMVEKVEGSTVYVARFGGRRL